MEIGVKRIINLHAPTGERTAKKERNPGALGIPELRSPAAMDFHSNEIVIVCQMTAKEKTSVIITRKGEVLSPFGRR